MATRSKTSAETSTAVLDAPNGERERVFDAFRRWGYLEAALDPLGFLRPVPHSDLPVDGEFAQEARRVYCGTVGVEFMHIIDPARRRWIQERLEGPQATLVGQQAFFTGRRDCAYSIDRRDSRCRGTARRWRTGDGHESSRPAERDC